MQRVWAEWVIRKEKRYSLTGETRRLRGDALQETFMADPDVISLNGRNGFARSKSMGEEDGREEAGEIERERELAALSEM